MAWSKVRKKTKKEREDARHKRPEPKAERVRPGSFVRTSGPPVNSAGPVLEKKVTDVLAACRETIERGLPYAYREQFTGTADFDYRVEYMDTMIVVALKHGCGERFAVNTIMKEGLSFEKRVELGKKAGRELNVLMTDHGPGCKYKTPKTSAEWKPLSGLSEYEKHEAIAAAIQLDEYETGFRPDPKRSLIPEPPPCPICGPQGDWADECDHDY